MLRGSRPAPGPRVGFCRVGATGRGGVLLRAGHHTGLRCISQGQRGLVSVCAHAPTLFHPGPGGVLHTHRQLILLPRLPGCPFGGGAAMHPVPVSGAPHSGPRALCIFCSATVPTAGGQRKSELFPTSAPERPRPPLPTHSTTCPPGPRAEPGCAVIVTAEAREAQKVLPALGRG